MIQWLKRLFKSLDHDEMSKEEMIRLSYKALEEHRKPPPKEQIRRLVERGTINEKGKV